MVPFLQFNYEKVERTAAEPLKSRDEDPGWDLALISLDTDTKGDPRKVYSTGLRLLPPSGYFFDIVPRPSLIRKGYTLADRCIVTRNTNAVVKVTLLKFDDDADVLTIPGRWVHAILVPAVHAVPAISKVLSKRSDKSTVTRYEEPVVATSAPIKYKGDSDDD